MGGTANRRTLIAIYVVMAIAVAIVAIVVISAGEDLEAEPSIAGGYDLAEPDPCLGTTFDLRQSGEFVNIENADNSLGGSLRTEQGRLTGDVSCVDGETAELRARGGGPRGHRHARWAPDHSGAHPRSPAAGSATTGPQVDRRRIQDQATLGLPRRRDRDRGRPFRGRAASRRAGARRGHLRRRQAGGGGRRARTARRSRSRARPATARSLSRSARRSSPPRSSASRAASSPRSSSPSRS